jgi:Late embryogenesis abundant protein
VSVRAENPNEMIGIKYGEGSSVVIAYRNSTLSSGKLPSFYQGHKNVTVMQVTLEGTHPYGSGLQKAIEESSNSGSVPLDVYVRVPFSLKLDSIDLREVTVNVHCALVVDSLSPNKKPNIKSATYDGNVEL